VTFHTTRWSLVFRAADGGPDGPAALAELCEAYWPAVHAFYRRAQGDEERARDLTQGLFARLLERHDLASADPERGRFRSWLLACAQHHLVDVRRADGAEKRGGARTLPWPDGAEAGPLEPVDPAATPEEAFARAWVRALVDRALAAIVAEEVARGRGRIAHAARPFLLPGGDDGANATMRTVAAELGTGEGAFKVAVHRLRERLRERIQAEVRQTVGASEEAGDELRLLLELSGGVVRPGPRSAGGISTPSR